MDTRRYLILAALASQAYIWSTYSAGAIILTDPAVLSAGATVNPLPDGFSGPNFTSQPGFPNSVSFNFSGGPAGTLTENILTWSTVDSAHPYSGLTYVFTLRPLTSGSVSELTFGGYSGFNVSVKQCSSGACENFNGSAGVAATSASRSSDGSTVMYDWSNGITGGTGVHSGHLQIFTNSTAFASTTVDIVGANGQVFALNGFFGPAPAVPEPATWAMILLGFIGIGFAAYWHKGNGSALAAA